MADKVEKQEECFIVGVIGKQGSEQRVHADWFFEGIVHPTFAEHFQNFAVLRADTMNTPGTITTQIIEKLLHAKLVIADLTYLNPNAFYEIGIRHMAGLPIIHVHQAGETIPFDVSTFRSMEYSRGEYRHMIVARENLRVLIESVLKPDYRVDNPVTQAQGRAQFQAVASAPDKVILSQLESLTARVAAVERDGTSHIFPKGLSASSILGFSGHGNLAIGNTRSSSEALRFELEDQMDSNALAEFKSRVLEPIFGHTIYAVRTAPRSLEVEYGAGSITDHELKQVSELAGRSGIIVSRV